MARYKGQRSVRAIERDFPHVVELPVPPGGLGKALDEIDEWHRSRSLPVMAGRNRYEEPQWFGRWHFARARDAEAFGERFGYSGASSPVCSARNS